MSDLDLKPQQIQKLQLYMQELSHFNQKFSLVSRPQTMAWDSRFPFYLSEKDRSCEDDSKRGQALSRSLMALVVDSVVAGQLLLKQAHPDPIADMGSGAGFPGLVLAILDPSREFWLYEVHKKKAGFLEHISWKLGLTNIQVKNMPIQEETSPIKQGVSKAFFTLSKRLELTKNVFKEGGCYYHLQSWPYQKEWANLPLHLKRVWTLISAQKYSYPSLLSERVLLKTKKL